MKEVIFSGMVDGLVVDHVAREDEFNMPAKHFHNEFEIYYLLKGTRYYFIENQSYLIEQGNLVLIHRQQIHKTTSPNNSYHERILLEFTDKPFNELLMTSINLSVPEFFNKYCGIIQLNIAQRKVIESILFQIIDEMNHKSVNYQELVKLKLSELLLYALRYRTEIGASAKNNTTINNTHDKVHEISEYIALNYQTPLSLNDLSSKFFINKCYLSRIFKDITGFTINEYINITRVKQAQLLLGSCDYSITEISKMVGYDSLTYFERVFKKFTETTPLKYRKKLLLIDEKKRERKSE